MVQAVLVLALVLDQVTVQGWAQALGVLVAHIGNLQPCTAFLWLLQAPPPAEPQSVSVVEIASTRVLFRPILVL